jgi:predicted 2-oxoglutarate/Fe(II)-dependent dioxygenase YbiX
MIVRIASVLSADELASIRARLEGGAWADGRITAGYQSAQVKTNLQLPHNDAAARVAGDAVLQAPERSPLFVSATLPRHDAAARALLFDLDTSVRELTATGADRASVVRLTNCYHNLLRRWADV